MGVTMIVFVVLTFLVNGFSMCVTTANTGFMADIIDYELDRSGKYIPAVITGTYSLVDKIVSSFSAASAVNEERLENHRELNDLCHRLDPTRLTTMANVFMLETDSPILRIPDINSYNLYFGWYLGELEQTDEFFDEYHAKYPDRVVGFSEYGADANPAFHSSTPEKGDYTEEYQALYHEHMLRMIGARPYLWATHVWNLFDFVADGRDEGGKHGENQKGLVTFDRTLRKDAFLTIALENGIEGVVLESHRNWIDKDPVRSLELSAGWLNERF